MATKQAVQTDTKTVSSQVLRAILIAQNKSDSKHHVPYTQALREIKAGRKRSHWIWYVFPCWHTIRKTSRPRYSLKTLEEGKLYLLHPELSQRLVEITVVAGRHLDGTRQALLRLFGYIDSSKFVEVMTFFAVAAGELKNKEQFMVFKTGLELAKGGKLHLPTIQALCSNNPQVCSTSLYV